MKRTVIEQNATITMRVKRAIVVEYPDDQELTPETIQTLLDLKSFHDLNWDKVDPELVEEVDTDEPHLTAWDDSGLEPEVSIDAKGVVKKLNNADESSGKWA